jgi:hypothetical protein
MTVKRLKWDKAKIRSVVSSSGAAFPDAKIEHGDMVHLQIGDLIVLVRVQEGTYIGDLERGEYGGIVRSMQGTINEPIDLRAGDHVVFTRRHIFLLNKHESGGGWTSSQRL